MVKRLLLISSLPARQLVLSDLLSHFKSINQPFVLLTKAKRLLKRGYIEKWLVKKSYLPLWSPFIFLIFLPLLWVIFGLGWLVYLWRWHPQVVVLFNWPEKIIFSSLAHWFKLRVIWFEYPERSVDRLPMIVKFFYRRLSRYVKVVVFGQDTAQQFSALFKPQSITILKPASSAKNFKQPSIFNKLAEQNKRSRFVVGAVLYGLPREQAEKLLAALAITQSVCPLIELVIIGEGKNRKQIQWLARHMNLERKIWLAGPTSDWQRWVGQLDVYIMANKKPGLEDASWALNAMAFSLPVIAPMSDWLKDFITAEVGVLLDINNPELLARQLIAWQQNEALVTKLGRGAHKLANNLSFDNFTNSFLKLLS